MLILKWYYLKTNIEQSLLSGNALDQLQASPVVITLMDQVREIKEERDVLEGQLKEVKCDMSQYQSVTFATYT